ncbi:type I-C CRISPR-associated protein Cas8c/Csd1 [Bittarella massiliensis (ex Durand et al. 2017)]|uniref:type I-C CRISPR-associated protein Cas8c/Csd1 n=1 Tax=Bittarella massiliensis (ex Durand et al. 2017) TaxID=1720313 RepID=UPI001AA199A9|nr:type I-C CRISPR-associated protein Cas8c/Csd1 [Bittarella massiliensis (ex Durand et al. 2017)]MBO1680370.1 type I-C CRISPR-associated protein Cas8c/Csd1 [Bittarella massiliensis (ex Durand et al. 2017)]
MILQSLVEYYEILLQKDKDGSIPQPGYSPAKVSYALELSPEGEILGVFSLRVKQQRGKKEVEVPQVLLVPEQDTRAVNIHPYFLCDNSGYLLGRDKKGKPERTAACFAAARDLHLSVLEGTSSPAGKAVYQFFTRWDPALAEEHPILAEYLDELIGGGSLVFTFDGRFVQEDPIVKAQWEQWRTSHSESPQMQCLVTGQESPVAVLHPKIKGVRGAQSVGASLVSFNAPAYESYGRSGGQGLNAPVGEYAAFAYGTALNWLLSNRQHHCQVGDTTVVYWAADPNPQFVDLFNTMMGNIESEEEDPDHLLAELFTHVERGDPVAGDLSLSTPFYVLGLAPNAARLSVRFFLQSDFGTMVQNIHRHYRDLSIERAPYEREYLTLYWLLRETVNPNARDKIPSSPMAAATLRAIIMGDSYPEALYESVLLRVRAEQDNTERRTHKITRGRAAIIKACLLRKPQGALYREVLTMSLNKEYSGREPGGQAYVLGRLFAVLEKAQLDANPGINTTIKDRYFTSACTTPAAVFPTLLMLAQHHISKARYGYYSDQQIGDLLDKLEVDNRPYPKHLTLEEQGLFILGYYHQVKARYEKADSADKNTDDGKED